MHNIRDAVNALPRDQKQRVKQEAREILYSRDECHEAQINYVQPGTNGWEIALKMAYQRFGILNI